MCIVVNLEIFIFMNTCSFKRHICDFTNSGLGYDLPISMNDSVILPFWEDYMTMKLLI